MQVDNFKDKEEYYDQRFIKLINPEMQLKGSRFDECEFIDCDFSQAIFTNCKFNACRFVGCNLSLVSLSGSRLFAIEFIESKLVGVDFTSADWPTFHLDFELKFVRSILSDISMFGLTLNRLTFDECKVVEADFREGNFAQSSWTYCDFSKSLFMKTNMQGIDFSDSYHYDIDVLHNRIDKAKFSRFEALNLLTSLGIELVD
jgi:uncharacterized protein YjbI with pentapeptide repeats